MKRGDIHFAQLDLKSVRGGGAEIQKTRPVVIVSNDVANRASSLVSVVPISSNISRVFPFEVPLSAEQSGLPKDSKAMAQQIRTIDKSRLAHQRSGSLKRKQLAALDEALRLHLGL